MAFETPKSVDIKITYGHDDTHVIVQFSQMIQNNRLTPKQTREMIEALQNAMKKLAAHKKKKRVHTFQ